MDWIKAVEDAIEYIEENITENLTIAEIANKVNLSAFTFKKAFLCCVDIP